MMLSERYYQEIEALTTYFRERVPACGPIVLTDEQRKAGVDSLTGLAADLVKASFTEWLLMRKYELSYNQTCCAFFAALDNPASPPESQLVGEPPRLFICPHCGYDESKWVTIGMIKVDAETETETFIRAPQQPVPRVCGECGHDDVADGLCQEEVDTDNLSPMAMLELNQEFWDGDILRCGCKCVFAPSE